MQELQTIPDTYSYSASAILHLFNNALTIQQSKKIIALKGIYQPGRGVNYNGYYYDQLKDEISDATLSLIVPALLRQELVANKLIEFYGFITKKVVNAGGRIEIQVNMSSLVNQTNSKYTEEDVRSLEIQQEKAAAGYRDVGAFIKDCIVREVTVSIIILIGKTGIIDSDIKHQLEETQAFYHIRFVRINLNSVTEIVEAFDRFDNEETGILMLSRGGGENLEIFDKPAIAERAIRLQPYFVTAIGHKENVSLLQRVADKSFITPTALGQYLNDVYNETMEQWQDSKAKLVADISLQLKTGYEQQVNNLQQQLHAAEQLHRQTRENVEAVYVQETGMLKQQLIQLEANYKRQLEEIQNISDEKLSLANERLTSQQVPVNKNRGLIWIAIIAGLIIGLLLGKGCNHLP